MALRRGNKNHLALWHVSIEIARAHCYTCWFYLITSAIGGIESSGVPTVLVSVLFEDLAQLRYEIGMHMVIVLGMGMCEKGLR
jgi:hypothetical protein